MSCYRSPFASILETLIEFFTPFSDDDAAKERWANGNSANGQLEEDINTLVHGLSVGSFLEEFGHLMTSPERQVIRRMLASFDRFVSVTPQENIPLDFFGTAAWLDLQQNVISSLPILRRLKAASD